MNLIIGDDEREEEGNVDHEVKDKFMNPKEERIFRSISKIGKWPKFDVPIFLGNLNPEELIN